MAGSSQVPDRPNVAPSAAWPPLLVLVVILGTWQAYVTMTGIPTVILPSPIEVVNAAVAAAPTLVGAAVTTAVTAVLGLAGGIVLGLAFAFGMVESPTAAAVLHPYLIALRIAPLMAIAPLVFLWIGTGIVARALLVVTLTVFPVAIASLDGLRSTPETYLDLMQSVGPSDRAIFLRVRIPAAAPSVFAGVKLAAALSVIGTVVAEFLTLSGGLGYRVFAASTALDTPGMFAALFALGGLGLLFYGVPALIEDAIPWTETAGS